MCPLHPLLKRQLKHYSLDTEQHSGIDQLLQRVSDTYAQMDKERRFFEHVISVNSTELNDKNRQLRSALRSLNTAQRISNAGSWTLDLASGVITASSQTFRILHLDPEQPLEVSHLHQRVHPDDIRLADPTFLETIKHGSFDCIYRLRLNSGETRYLHEHRELEMTGDGTPVLVHGSLQDITRHKQVEQDLRLFADVFHQCAEGIMLLDQHQNVVTANSAWCRLTGYTAEELPGMSPLALLGDGNPDDLGQQIARALATAGMWQGEVIGRRKDGSCFPQLVSVGASRDENGRLLHYIVNITDITQRKAVEQQVRYLAHHDVLTGLPNRFSMQEQLNQAINESRLASTRLALMFIDMDHFKHVNDSLGHAAGDSLLVSVSRRLRSQVAGTDVVARIGGDEFVVICRNIKQLTDVARLAARLVEALNKPYLYEQQLMLSSPSIGISLYPDNGQSADDLLKAADAAMYQAKQSGRNRYRFCPDLP